MADSFVGPPAKQGVIGRLALDRQLSDYGFDVLISISGLASETIKVCSESVSGRIQDDVKISREANTTLIPGAVLQNGNFTIRLDDLAAEWDNLCFIKSGGSDRVSLTVESPFDYVEARQGSVPRGVPVPSDGWGLGDWGSMAWGG